MKEINAAYDMLTGKNVQRQTLASRAVAGYGGAGYGQQGYAGPGHRMQLRSRCSSMCACCCRMGDWRRAEMFLTQVQERTAEWHFLMGMIILAKRAVRQRADSSDPGGADGSRQRGVSGKTKSSLTSAARNSAADGVRRPVHKPGCFAAAARCVRS